MNRRKIILILVPVLLISTIMLFAFRQKTDPVAKNKVLSELLYSSLNQAHFNMKEVDDDFSKSAFALYLKAIDNTKRFLLKSDVEQLEQYADKMDDEFKAGNSKMLNATVEILDQRIPQAKTIVMDLLDKSFDFTLDEKYQLDPEKRGFPKDEAELKESWRKLLKYQALIRYQTSIKTEDAKKKKASEDGTDFDAKSMATMEEEAREQLKKTYNNTFDFLDKMDRDDRAAEYFNAMMSVADPHTEYFPPEDKENFDIRMSGKLEGIGAQLQQVDGVIKVSRIVPGSASWKQKELKAEDIILKVAQGEEEPVDISAMPLKDAVKLIRGEKGSEVRLTVKKPDGVITVIPIIRDVVILEENFAKSAIIEEKGKKFGYIKLPSFYADFAKSGGRNSAVDVRLELEKLKQQGAEEMILDLRFNGGGSLGDAIDMSGLFIEDGPVVQVKTKVAKTKVYADQDPQVVWKGDLVVLVNRFSASASEILAGALQDYERAIIVGTPSTYGKGTVQRFIDLDRMLRGGYAEYAPLGSLKLTIQKFYRITGKSTQWKGVESDIVLPDVYTFMDGEKDAKFALPWDEIESVKFDKWKDSPNVDKLKKKSEKRVKKSEVFSMIAENGKRLKEQREETELSLNYETYMKEQERLQAAAKKFENVGKPHDGWKITPTKSNVKNEAMDKNRKDLNEAWQKEIKKDEVIAEALNILRDM